MASFLCHSQMLDMVLSPESFWSYLFGTKRIRGRKRDAGIFAPGEVPVQVIEFRSIEQVTTDGATSAAVSVTASKVANKIKKCTKEDGHSLQKTDCFRPKPSPLALRAFGGMTSDNDIWVECFYLNKKRQKRYFYRSYNTGRCVLSEPPSGARTVVYQRDLANAPPDIRQFAGERLRRSSVVQLKKERRLQVQKLRQRALFSRFLISKRTRRLRGVRLKQ